MKIRIAHSSDQHGHLTRFDPGFELKDIDLWVITGDLLPNSTRGEVHYEVPFQTDFLNANIEFFKKLFGSIPVLVQDGNHDYAPTQQILAAAGIDARQVLRTKQEIVLGTEKKAVSYAGFREINWLAGEWNGEARFPEICAIVDQVMGESPDLLITHSPTQGIMDGVKDSYGVASLASQLSYRPHTVKAHLHGHTHESHGIEIHNNIVFSNAATTIQIVEVDL